MPRGHQLPRDPGQRLIRAILGSEETTDCQSDKSIYARLKKYFTEPDVSLDPSPEINELLSELVSYLQGTQPDPDLCTESRVSTIEKEVCATIDKNAVLLSRSDAIRSIAIRAESRLEIFWTSSLITCTSQVDESLTPVEKVIVGCGEFPYTTNYVKMVETEAQVIKAHLRANKISVEAGRPINVAFCGSGPLPLTGMLLAACMDANVTLIDVDQEAIDLSQKLTENWEARGILPKGHVHGVVADGGKLRFRKGTKKITGTRSPEKMTVQCDVLFVAALIPNAIKDKIAETVSDMKEDGPLVVLRTAHGLTARLAYFQNRRHIITKYLDFIGLVAPIVHELDDGYIVDDDERPMEFFSEEILNSLELYCWRDHRRS